MKKLIAVLVFCALMMTGAALAETQQSWNQGSSWRLIADAQVWTVPAEAEAGTPDITLAKGTYVRVVAEDGLWTVIDYFAGGGVRSGAVLSSAVCSLDGPTQPPTPVPTAIPLATAIPSAVNPTPTPAADSGMLSPVLPAATPTPTPTKGTGMVLSGDLWVSIFPGDALQQAKIITLGSTTTLVEYNGQRMEVSTADLTCSELVAAGHQVAVITAPKGGSAAMRQAASTKSNTITKLQDGKLVCVLEEGPDFCLIWADSYRGYVTTGVLSFDVYVAEPYGTGTLRDANGKTTGNGTVNVRVTNKKTSTKAAEWPVGAQVTLLKKDGDWYLAELNGCRGYVYKTFVKEN